MKQEAQESSEKNYNWGDIFHICSETEALKTLKN